MYTNRKVKICTLNRIKIFDATYFHVVVVVVTGLTRDALRARVGTRLKTRCFTKFSVFKKKINEGD
jgi:hypothetical protein